MTLMAEETCGVRRRRRGPSVGKVEEEVCFQGEAGEFGAEKFSALFDAQLLNELTGAQSEDQSEHQGSAPPPSTDSKDSSSTDVDAKGRIFVAKIPRTVTEDEFKQYFSGYGVVSDAYMPRDRTQRYYRGIGFITFESEESANKVMAIKHRFHDQDVVVDYALPPKKQRTDQELSNEVEPKAASKNAPNTNTAERSSKSVMTSKPPPPQTSLLSRNVLQNHLKNVNCHDISSGLLSSARLPTAFADCTQKGMSLPSASVRRPQSQGTLDSTIWGVPAQDSMTLPAYYGTRFNEIGSGMRNSASRDFSMDGSLQHSHSFASTTDLSCMMHDGSTDFSSTGTFSQDSELHHLGQNSLRSMEMSPMSSLSHDDLFQAFRDLPQYASNTQTLQDLMAMHSMTRRMTSINLQSMNESGIYSPTERCSSQQSLLSSTYDHFGHHHDAVSEKLLSHSIGNSAFRSPISTIQLSFQNWQRGNPKVFVAHMPKGMTRRDITEYFNQFGAVLDIYVPQPWDIPADQAGFAFVSFQSSASVQKVVAYGTHWIRNYPVNISMSIA